MSKDKKRLVPVRRFKEFENSAAWEQRKLGEIVKVTIGEFVIKTKQKEDSPYPVYNGGTSYTGFYDDYNNSPNKIIISARGANAGFVNIVRQRYWAGNSCYSLSIINNQEVDLDYLYQMLKQRQHLFTDFQQAANIPSVSKKDVETFIIYTSSFEEQKKIGEFLIKFDSLIALHQRKLDKLKRVKSAYLTELFPAEGEREPKRRFPGFTGAWEQRKLGEVAEKITKGTTPHDKRWFGPVNYVKTESIDSNNGNISVVANTSLEEHEGYLKRSQLEKDDVLFSIVGTLGRVGVVKKKDLPANTNQQICIIRPFKENSFFLLNALKTNRVKSFIKSDATIGAQPSLSLWQIEGLRIPFPILEEQQKIGKFFQQLDSLIALHQRKLDKLKKMKAAYLNEMFV
ncbi:restriction endonuclease subunit S [Limosilactobacillus reuteri]|uniref:restriction endonuclease subunit S n=1 Tax=Limosilactobacillus reuteri TaxID=1598 RepID=UPI001E4FF781|nr:restriction endonuclease subunit S [Limosilactobacillus reuteri]MCC4372381.1 restriction endonuclease subunit S [Limosilactobacillus reuteri]